MAFFKRAFVTTAALTAVGSSLLVYDVSRNQVYACQPFSEAFHHYITIRGWRLLGYMYKKKLEVASRDVCKTQEEFLLRQLKENCCTEYGMRFGFNDMRNICDFQRCHPITTYKHFKPYIERMLCGEPNILLKDTPVLFASTAGTSGHGRKMVPVSQRQRDIYFREGMAVATSCVSQCFTCTNRDKLFKALYLFHNPLWKMTRAGVKGGPNALSADGMRKIMYLFTSPSLLLEVPKEADLDYLHLLFALLDCKVASIETTMAATLLYALKTMEFDRPKLLKDISFGKINPQLDLRCDVRKCLEAMVKPNCDRAKMIQQAFECGPEGLGLRLWPNLQVAVCIDSGVMERYGEELRSTYLKGVHIYSPLYAAAEGLIGINVWPKNLPTRYMLDPRAMFFELIPVENMNEDQPNTVLLKEAEVDQEYELCVTNASGLYRYRLEDVVRVCGFHHESPIVEFLYRRSQTLNLAKEEFNEKLFLEALQEGTKDWEEFKLVDYAVVPGPLVRTIINQSKDDAFKEKFQHERLCYFVFIEAEGQFLNPNEEQILSLETAMGEKCPAYLEQKERGIFEDIKVFLVHPTTFLELKDAMNEFNKTTTDQFKYPRQIVNADQALMLMNQSL